MVGNLYNANIKYTCTQGKDAQEMQEIVLQIR